jgi:hypothetical protein
MKTAKEMFEDLGYKYQPDCYEHPLRYRKDRKTTSVYEIDEDSFTFYSDEDKSITIWKDGHVFQLKQEELQAINQQVKELHWDEN